jgi:hypothetical protein
MLLTLYINILKPSYNSHDTLSVEIINTTKYPVQVQFWALPFYRLINGQWVLEFVGYPGATSGDQVSTGPYIWNFLDPGESQNESVSLELYSIEEGNYRVRLYYRFDGHSELSYVYSNDFQLIASNGP